MQRLWETHAPVEEFQKVLDIWVEAHRTGCEMYSKRLLAESRPDHYRELIASTIPKGAVLIATRYDGVGRPLAEVAACWCRQALWKVDHVQDSSREVIGCLKPGCGCLDVPQALACSNRCVQHCVCRKRPSCPQTK